MAISKVAERLIAFLRAACSRSAEIDTLTAFLADLATNMEFSLHGVHIICALVMRIKGWRRHSYEGSHAAGDS